MLAQTVYVLGEHADGVRVELASGVQWHVEVADDDKSVVQQRDLHAPKFGES